MALMTRRIAPATIPPAMPPFQRRRLGGGGQTVSSSHMPPPGARDDRQGGMPPGLGQAAGMMGGLLGASPEAGPLAPAEAMASWGPMTRVSMMGLDDAGPGAWAGLLGAPAESLAPPDSLVAMPFQAAPQAAMEIAPEVAAEAAGDATLAASGFGSPLAATSILGRAFGVDLNPISWIGGLFD